MRSGGRERGLLRLELRRVEVRGLALGRTTWRQKAGGSLPADVANGPALEAFALVRKVRRRGNGACSALAPRRIEDEGFAPRATSGSGRIGVRSGSRLQTDRDGEFASYRGPAAEGSRFASSPGCKRIEAGSLLPIEVRQRMDRSLLGFEAANGSRREVRFSSKVRRAEGSGFASVRGSRRGCGKIGRLAFRLRRVLAERRFWACPGSADCEGTRSRSKTAEPERKRFFALIT